MERLSRGIDHCISAVVDPFVNRLILRWKNYQPASEIEFRLRTPEQTYTPAFQNNDSVFDAIQAMGVPFLLCLGPLTMLSNNTLLIESVTLTSSATAMGLIVGPDVCRSIRRHF